MDKTMLEDLETQLSERLGPNFAIEFPYTDLPHVTFKRMGNDVETHGIWMAWAIIKEKENGGS
jgi:hypothetical protein